MTNDECIDAVIELFKGGECLRVGEVMDRLNIDLMTAHGIIDYLEQFEVIGPVSPGGDVGRAHGYKYLE